MAGALAGLTVVSIEQAVAAPLCTARLADAGARVIKVERHEGDFAREYDHVVRGESAYFVWLNRGKESIALNYKRPGDAALLAAMIARADIFVQNLAPGALDKAGFGSVALRARHPSLITCDISGYGDDGAAREMKAYDLLIQCETGLAAVSGAPSEAGRVGVSVADVCCGMNAHAAILEALYDRDRTGSGRGIAVSLFDGLAEWMTVPLLQYEHGGNAPRRIGLAHPSIVPYGAYRAGDGRRVVVAVQNEREWARFCRDVLLLPALAGDARFASNSARVANRGELDAAIEAAFSPIDSTVLVERLRAASIAYGSVNEVSDLSRHPFLRRVEVETPAGRVSLPAPAVRVVGVVPVLGPSPSLDAHGAALRDEFG